MENLIWVYFSLKNKNNTNNYILIIVKWKPRNLLTSPNRHNKINRTIIFLLIHMFIDLFGYINLSKTYEFRCFFMISMIYLG